jgi:TPR repeat protein
MDKQTPPPVTPRWPLALALILALITVASASYNFGLRANAWLPAGEPGNPEARLQLAEQEFKVGDYRDALTFFRQLANQGDPVAEYWLAHMTELGIGTAKDPSKAVDLYKKAAAQGDVAAQTRIGEIYLDGNIVPPDFETAKTYLEKAAFQGSSRAATLLGQIYRLGLGTPADPTESFAWLEVATLEHNALAQHERRALLTSLDPQQQEAAVARVKTIMSAIKDKTPQPARSASVANAAQPSGNTVASK